MRRTLTTLAVSFCVILGLAAPGTAADGDGRVLSASATPYGISLAQMVKLTAAFQTSGRDLRYFPHTPLKILFVQNQDVKVIPVGKGFEIVGQRSFSFSRGSVLWVPMSYGDDSPPVIGTFPTTHTQALHYWFDKSGLGASRAQIVIDGAARSLDHDYLTGPVTTDQLKDCGGDVACGRHLVVESAFLAGLPAGKHTIEVLLNLDGALLKTPEAGGIPFLRTDLTYHVTITR